MLRAQLSFILLSLSAHSASAASLPSNPFTNVAEADWRAHMVLPAPELYTVESTKADSETCQTGWDYVYFSKVDRTRDVKEVAKARVRYFQVESAKGCQWTWDTIVTNGEEPAWGTEPLTNAFAGSVTNLASAYLIANKQFSQPFTLESVYITKPALENGPLFTYLLMGNVCNNKTYLLLDGGTGKVFDAPQKPSCPA